MKSDTIGSLAKALAQAQAKMKGAELNAQNPFFQTRYADLGAVIEAARPALAAHGLSFTQLIVNGEPEQIGIETILLHESGEWISSLFHIHYGDEKGRSLAQSAGAVITYLRRYALASILGVYAGDDDDGNSAGKAKEKTKSPAQSDELRPFTQTMTLETAMNVINHEGLKYGELLTDTLMHMVNTLDKSIKAKKYNDEKMIEAKFKLDACRTILQARATNPVVAAESGPTASDATAGATPGGG